MAADCIRVHPPRGGGPDCGPRAAPPTRPASANSCRTLRGPPRPRCGRGRQDSQHGSGRPTRLEAAVALGTLQGVDRIEDAEAVEVLVPHRAESDRSHPQVHPAPSAAVVEGPPRRDCGSRAPIALVGHGPEGAVSDGRELSSYVTEIGVRPGPLPGLHGLLREADGTPAPAAVSRAQDARGRPVRREHGDSRECM